MNWLQQINGAGEAKYSNTPPEIKPPEMAGWGQERLVAAGHRATKQVHDLAGAATGVLDREGVAGRFDDWLNRCLRTNIRDAVAGAVGGIANVFAAGTVRAAVTMSGIIWRNQRQALSADRG